MRNNAGVAERGKIDNGWMEGGDGVEDRDSAICVDPMDE